MNDLFKNYNAKKIIVYIFLLLTILNCASIYFSSIINNLWRILLFLIFIYSIPKISGRLLDKFIIFISIFSIYMLIFLICNYIQSPTFSLINYIFLFIIDPLMLITFFVGQSIKQNMNKVLYVFENIVLVLAVISLVFWALSIAGLRPNMSFVTHWGGINRIQGYYGLDFLSQRNTTFLGLHNVVRNCGIFAEPPMYSYVLCIALFVELFLKKQTSFMNFKVILLFITIISTTSTTGLLISIPAIMLKFYLYSNNNVIKSIVLICIPIILYLLHLIVQYKINNVSSQTYGASSYIQRHDDIISCFHAWLNHPFLGNGINNSSISSKFNIVPINVYINMGVPIEPNIGGTTGLMSVLAYGGLAEALFYIIPSLLISFKSLYLAIFSILSFILLIFTSINESFLCIMLLSYFWSYILIYKPRDIYTIGGEV